MAAQYASFLFHQPPPDDTLAGWVRSEIRMGPRVANSWRTSSTSATFSAAQPRKPSRTELSRCHPHRGQSATGTMHASCATHSV